MKLIGDVLAGTVVCQVLAEKYPNAEIHYLVNDSTRAVVDNHPAINQLIIFNPKTDAGIHSFWRFIQKIKARNYDIIYDLYAKLQSQLICFLSAAPSRISYYKWYSTWCYTETVKRSYQNQTSAGPAIENRLRLFYRNKPLPRELPLPRIYLTAKEQHQADDILAQADLTDKVLIMVSALGSRDLKTWPLAYTAHLLDYLVAHYQVELLFNYLPGQITEADQLHQLCQKHTQRHIHLDVYSENLRLFLALLNRCQGIIGNEGGAINMGKALNIASFSIFAPWIDPDGWGMSEDGKRHVSVHLRDFKPELYRKLPMKNLKTKSIELYQELTPNRVLPSFMGFCQYNLSNYLRD